MSSVNQLQIVRNGSPGLEILGGTTKFEKTHRLTEKPVRVMKMSADGSLLAWAEANRVKIISLTDYSTKFEVELPGVMYLKLSPKAKVVACWYPFRSNIDETNLYMYNIESGQLLTSLAVKKMSRWEPFWSDDEAICCRHLNTELLFHENNCFERYVNKFFTQKVSDFSMATSKSTGALNIACYTTGVKGQPSFVRLYKYPRFEATLANKSFFKADTIQFSWSPKGDAVLLQCASDVDKTGKSYYGEQSLYYMDVSGTTFAVRLSKEGSIHNCGWTPNTTGESLFCVIHGFIPPKVGLFNSKGDVIFEFAGEVMKVNLVAFNPFGNLLALAGFGNLRGGIHIWDVKRKKKICHFDCPETTDLSWSPDGNKLLTSTTAPRLRVGNGIKVWKYIGVKTFEDTFATDVELYKAAFQPRPGFFQEPDILDVNPNEKPVNAAAPARYVPPGMRTQGQHAAAQRAVIAATKSHMGDAKPAMSTRDKKIKNLEKKLADIIKLKSDQKNGKVLEKSQLEKVAREQALVNELAQLKLE
ncbi:Eukaryotic translation initiation factor 2A [Halotydeus destructor]|nr:Eukaryotic translation initiation factor 2A [Halotydeus destructor]